MKSLAATMPLGTAMVGPTLDPPVRRAYLANRAGAVNHRQFVGQGRPTAGPQLGRAGGRTRLTHQGACPICFAEGLSESRTLSAALTGSGHQGPGPGGLIFLPIELNKVQKRLESRAKSPSLSSCDARTGQAGARTRHPRAIPTPGDAMRHSPYLGCRTGWSTALAVAGGALALLTLLSLLDRGPRNPPQRCARRNCRKRFQAKRQRQAFCSAHCARRCGIGGIR